MRKITAIFLYLFCFINFITSCKTYYQPQSVVYNDYRILSKSKQDSTLIKLLKPYSDSVNKSMNDEIAVAETELEKKQPEGSLGNILTDAMLDNAKKSFNTKVHGAFLNSGAIRLTSLPAGKITRGKIFELSPFENLIVLQKLSGITLQNFINHISERGGWPVSGITWQIKNQSAGKEGVNILVNGEPINYNAEYTIATLDYVANGGDDCAMLKVLPQINKGVIFRDAIIEYFAAQKSMGKKITAKIEKRVSYAE